MGKQSAKQKLVLATDDFAKYFEQKDMDIYDYERNSESNDKTMHYRNAIK